MDSFKKKQQFCSMYKQGVCYLGKQNLSYLKGKQLLCTEIQMQ